MARLYSHFRMFVKRLKRDGDAKKYKDLALTPEPESDTDRPEIMPLRIAVAR
jgi:hypothetical protein